MTLLHANRALLPGGWANDVRIAIDGHGLIATVDTDVPASGDLQPMDCVLPGIANIHSHAFQRALAGRTECGSENDSFWTWRKLLYRFVDRINPEQMHQIATQLYIEMLKAGYTTVAEFHYLHHQAGGQAYADPAAMSHALIEAAGDAGIQLTLLPALYMQGGFGGAPAEAAQRRFVSTVDGYLDLLSRLSSDTTPGIAFHSLRAVAPEAIDEVMSWRSDNAGNCPVHIHAAEQSGEVGQCLAWSGMRPVEWLLNRGIDASWCIVHATHLTADEIGALASSGAVAGLCPTTEANLGDGIFPLAEYLRAGGHIAIGSDSHVSVSPIEELRWLEYTQRLEHRQRNIAAGPDQPHTGQRLVEAVLAGGARATEGTDERGSGGHIAAGYRADLVEIDTRHPTLVQCADEDLLDCLVFSGNHNPVRHVMSGGRWVIRDGHHELENRAESHYRKTLAALLN